MTSLAATGILANDSRNELRGASDFADLEIADYSKLPAEPLVSVFMITYQHAAFIREALDSVLAQKVSFPFEICLGEDGSSDGTREICREYSKRHPDKIRLFLRNRSNPAREAFQFPYMFNAASTFDACRGKYVALLEGDDYWLHPHKLQSQVDDLEANPALGGSCHYASCLFDKAPWLGNILPGRHVGDFPVEALLKRHLGNLHTSTWLVRRVKPLPWHLFKTSGFGDYPIVIWSLLSGNAKVIQRVWSAYRVHSGGVFSPLSSEVRLHQNTNLWKCLVAMAPEHVRPAARIGLARTRVMETGELAKAYKFGSAWKSFSRAWQEIANMEKGPEKKMLRRLAIESLFFPYLAGVLRRLRLKRPQC